jgi:allophanate hydrolase subunit 1
MIDSALPITVETTVDMRLNQAEAEGMDFFVGDEEVSKKEMLATMNEYSDQVKEDSIEQGKNWYKTYATLNVDYKNNKITFEQTPDEMDEIDGDVNTNKKSKRYNDSKTLNKEQKKWLKGRK